MSIAKLLGWPEAVQTTVLLFTIALVVAPLLSGVKFGGIEIPRLDPRRRRALRVVGPVSFVLAIVLIVPLQALRPANQLRILAADVMENGDIDVAIVNSGTSPALLKAIELQVTRERRIIPRPVLETSAKYRVVIGDRSGRLRGRLAIRHLIPAGATERLLIHPGTSRAASMQLTFHVADGSVMRTIVELQQEAQ